MAHRKYHKALRFLPALAVLLAAAGCSGDTNVTGLPEPEPAVCTDTYQRKSFAHHVIGFYPAWKHDVLPVSQIRRDKLTRVIYAFAVLDGVDIDWERWTKDSNNVPVVSAKAALVALLEALRNAFEPAGLKISISGCDDLGTRAPHPRGGYEPAARY